MASRRYHVFLSYNEQHRPAVDELARWLVREGLKPFFDSWDLIPGEPRQEALENALIASSTCAVVLGAGEDGIDPWQEVHLRAAIDRQVCERAGEFRVIPVLLPGAKWPEGKLPAFLKRNERIAFDQTLDDAEALHRLSCGIRGEPPGPRPGAAIFQGVEPYRGLRVFEEEHAPLFFGRERLTRELVELLREPAAGGLGERLLAVLGPSGSGKSSLVRAGLVPALRRGALEGSASWPVAVLKPGAQPLESLAVALETLGRKEVPPISVYDRVAKQQDGARSLHVAARLILGEPPLTARLLVVIDQFEEVFTLCPTADLRASLIDNLLGAAAEAGGPVVVVLAMRADFYGHCAEYRGLADLMARRQKLVGAMNPEELRWAIEKPAQRCGGTLDPGLVELLLQDALGRVHHGPGSERAGEGPSEHSATTSAQPGHLPLLEFALSKLWSRRVGGRLTTAAYLEIGGLVGALERHADAVLEQLAQDDPANELICRRVFLSLVHPGQGTVDTRRSAAYPALATNARAEQVIRTLIDARLLTTDDTNQSSATVDLAHEALIQNWTKLRRWITAERDDLFMRDRLADDARQWAAKRARHPDYLYDGGRLALAVEWADKYSDEAWHSEYVTEFLEASRAAEQKRQKEAARKRRHWLTALFATLTLAVGFAIAAGIGWRRATINAETAEKNENVATKNANIAKEQKAEAENQAKIATSRQLAALSVAERDKRYDRALLLAVEALRAENTFEARDSLFKALLERPGLRSYLHIEEGHVVDVAFSPDGGTLAVGFAVHGGGGGVVLWDAAARSRLGEKPLPVPEGRVAGVAFSPDGKTLAAGFRDSDGGGVLLWDPAARERLPGGPLLVPEGQVAGVAFSPDGRTLAAGYAVHGDGPAVGKGGVVLWDVAARTRLVEGPLPVPEGQVAGVAFSPDGETLAAGYAVHGEVRAVGTETGGVVLWDVAARTRMAEGPLLVPEGQVADVAFSPDGRTLAAGFGRIVGVVGAGGVVLWDATALTRMAEGPLPVPEGQVAGVAFSPDGKTLAAGFGRNLRGAGALVGVGGVVVWDTAARSRLVEGLLPLPEGRVAGVAFSPGGGTLVAGFAVIGHGSADGVVLWDAVVRERLVKGQLPVPEGRVVGVAFSPDGGTLAAGFSRGVVIGGEGLYDRVGISPDGKAFGVGFGRGGGGVVLWDTVTRKRLAEGPLSVPDGHVAGVAFSPGGKTLAAGFVVLGGGGGVVLWDAASRRLLAEKPLPVPEGPVAGVAFSPDGKTLAVGFGRVADGVNGGGVTLWDAAARERLPGGLLPVPEGHVTGVAFSPDGGTLAAGVGVHGGSGVGLVLWNVGARERLPRSLVSVPEVHFPSVAFSPGGRTFAAGIVVRGYSGVMLWDATARNQPLPVPEGAVASVAISPGDRTLAAGYGVLGGFFGGGVVLWDVATRERLAEGPLAVPGGDVAGVAFSPDGTMLAAGFSILGGGGGVAVFDVDLESWQCLAGQIANRNFTRKEFHDYFPEKREYHPTFPELPVPPAGDAR